MIDKWDMRWLSMARFVSHWSKDPRTQCGAIIARGKDFVSLGFNGFPDCIEDREEWLNDRETKHKLVIHCEINAFDHTKDNLVGCSLYTYPFPPCGECAKDVAAKGIKRVVAGPEERYKEESLFVFEKANIELIMVKDLGDEKTDREIALECEIAELKIKLGLALTTSMDGKTRLADLGDKLWAL